jgi:hypothetical protein
MKTIFLVAAALAAFAVILPAHAKARYRALPGAYWGSYGTHYMVPFYRGNSYEPDPFIRGQIRRDIPLRYRGQ